MNGDRNPDRAPRCVGRIGMRLPVEQIPSGRVGAIPTCSTIGRVLDTGESPKLAYYRFNSYSTCQGALVIMAALYFCKVRAGVRFPHTPPTTLMLHIGIREIQVGFSRYLRQLPIIVTRHEKPVCMVVPMDYDPYGNVEEGEEDNLRMLIKLGRDFLTRHPDRVTPKVMMDAAKRLKEIEKRGEVGSIINESTKDVFGGDVELPEKEEVADAGDSTANPSPEA